METNRLRQFCTVVETGNLRKASKLLNISHSGLFKSIKVLETEVGYPLFVPSGRGVVVSDPGKLLYERTTRFFEELEQLLGKKNDPPHTRVRIGSFEVFTSYFIGKLFKDYLPGSEVEIHELVPGRLEEALLLNRIDLGITYEPIPRPGIEYVKVTKILMAAYVVNNAFLGKDILDIPFAVPVNPLEGTPSGVKGLDAWPENRFKRKSFYQVDLMMTALDLTRQGLCAIFIPQFVAKLHNESIRPDLKLSALPLPHGMNTVFRDVYLVKRESTSETDALKKIAKALRLICGNRANEGNIEA
jgi:DNA-binding transcriptional LysR family regulator